MAKSAHREPGPAYEPRPFRNAKLTRLVALITRVYPNVDDIKARRAILTLRNTGTDLEGPRAYMAKAWDFAVKRRHIYNYERRERCGVSDQALAAWNYGKTAPTTRDMLPLQGS